MATHHGELPDLFERPDGARISTDREWSELRLTWIDRFAEVLYGGLPPAPSDVRPQQICHWRLDSLGGAATYDTYRLHVEADGASFGFTAHLTIPDGSAPHPAVLNGDGCWRYLSDEVVQQFVSRGLIVAQFDRTEVAADVNSFDPGAKAPKRGGIFELYNGAHFGAIAAWAWAYHRVVDFVERLPFVDASRIAITGHSRGGKAALLAGATDERIAVVNDNAGGAAGAAAFRYAGEGSESLEHIVSRFPLWFGPDITSYVGREAELPFDQHALLAAVAPRALLLTYALGDRFANPEGMVQSVRAAQTVYEFVGAADRIAFHLRDGEHRHGPEDLGALLDFLGHVWDGHRLSHRFNSHPYELKPAFDWRTP